MNEMSGVGGPYIVWELAGGYEWEPSSYDTLEEALTEARDMKQFVITQLVQTE